MAISLSKPPLREAWQYDLLAIILKEKKTMVRPPNPAHSYNLAKRDAVKITSFFQHCLRNSPFKYDEEKQGHKNPGIVFEKWSVTERIHSRLAKERKKRKETMEGTHTSARHDGWTLTERGDSIGEGRKNSDGRAASLFFSTDVQGWVGTAVHLGNYSSNRLRKRIRWAYT